MGIYIKGVEKPIRCASCFANYYCILSQYNWSSDRTPDNCPIIRVPPHGDLIDRDVLRQSMYHEAFETDSPMQKWDSGCWIRYKMFERAEENAPTVIPAEEGE